MAHNLLAAHVGPNSDSDQAALRTVSAVEPAKTAAGGMFFPAQSCRADKQPLCHKALRDNPDLAWGLLSPGRQLMPSEGT